jgi:uracil-DNA glycosylase family protein
MSSAAEPRIAKVSRTRNAARATAGQPLEELRRRAGGCRDCDLWKDATQTVFGEGPASASLMLVGEQPGDREDREGRPFVGPAGALLERALEQAGVAREQAYVTNVVKHFKYRARGKRRIHQRPDAEEIAICRQWLDAELDAVRPAVLVCLGLTAAHALLGSGLKIGRDCGRLIDSELAPAVFLTAHPSSVLRERDAAARHAALAALVSDLRVARAAC